jgi:hypothetical protein
VITGMIHLIMLTPPSWIILHFFNRTVYTGCYDSPAGLIVSVIPYIAA